MATSDEPPPAGQTLGLSRGAWGSQSFDVVRRSPAPPFWNSAPPPQSSNFLDLNAPFEEDPQPVSRGVPNFMDHLGPGGPSEGTISFLNPGKDTGGDGLRSFMDASGSSRNLNHDSDEASAVRDQEPQGQDTGPFVDYLSQFSGKKEGDIQEKERSKPVARDVSDFPDELLSLSSSYHKKRGEAGRTGRPLTDGAALFLASGRAQESPPVAAPESRNAKEPRPGPMGVNFASHRLDDVSSFRDVEKTSHGGEAQPGGASIEEKSLFPRNAVLIERNDNFYSMPNMARDERTLMLPTGSARETLDLSNNLSFKEEKFGMSRQTRVGLETSKEGMSLSLKRPYEEADAAEEYKRRREEEAVQASLYSRQGEGRDGGDENSDSVEASHLKRRGNRPGGEEQRFQNDHKRVQNDQSGIDDKSVVWPPVVIIENTRLSWDEERKKWKGLAASDIQKSLKNVENWEYAKVKPLFDIHGQKSSALVIFPGTFEGYFEAEALNDQLERSGKGKDQWMKVRPQDMNPRSPRGFNTPDLVSQDGKRILYGYLAQPEDIQRVDPQKNGYKWFIESFNEKVRKPAQQRHQMSQS
ncbi:unnamed protein product [Calypogeia fissa]